jgi:polysaccharide pyruvyl transferase WcaK-like protein
MPMTAFERRMASVTPRKPIARRSDLATATRRVDGSGQPKRIVLFGRFGTDNLGNDATLHVTLHHLRERLKTVEVACVCAKLPDFAADYGVTRLSLDPLPPRGMWRIGNPFLRNLYAAVVAVLGEPLRRWMVAEQLRGTDRLVVVGTGVLDDFGEVPWGMPAWLLRWCQCARAARATVQLLAIGAGPIRKSANRFLMRRAAYLSDVRSYRDDVSKEYMSGLGIDTKHDPVVPDLVFALPEEWIPSRRAPLSPPQTIGIGLMSYYGWANDNKAGRHLYEVYINKMAEFVDWLMTRGFQIRLLIGERNTDDTAISDLLKVMYKKDKPERSSALVANKIDSIAALISEIGHTDLVVASRYHNIICALALCKPVISIGYADKFLALLDNIGLGAYSQNIEELEIAELQRQFDSLMQNYQQLIVQIERKNKIYRTRLELLYNETFGSHPIPHSSPQNS